MLTVQSPLKATPSCAASEAANTRRDMVCEGEVDDEVVVVVRQSLSYSNVYIGKRH